ncbi:hypothetical protein L7F22_062176 [Adiantum nelumboides]|nr:hypothetical protein [Adiantum nelumboides]
MYDDENHDDYISICGLFNEVGEKCKDLKHDVANWVDMDSMDSPLDDERAKINGFVDHTHYIDMQHVEVNEGNVSTYGLFDEDEVVETYHVIFDFNDDYGSTYGLFEVVYVVSTCAIDGCVMKSSMESHAKSENSNLDSFMLNVESISIKDAMVYDDVVSIDGLFDEPLDDANSYMKLDIKHEVFMQEEKEDMFLENYDLLTYGSYVEHKSADLDESCDEPNSFPMYNDENHDDYISICGLFNEVGEECKDLKHDVANWVDMDSMDSPLDDESAKINDEVVETYHVIEGCDLSSLRSCSDYENADLGGLHVFDSSHAKTFDFNGDYGSTYGLFEEVYVVSTCAIDGCVMKSSMESHAKSENSNLDSFMLDVESISIKDAMVYDDVVSIDGLFDEPLDDANSYMKLDIKHEVFMQEEKEDMFLENYDLLTYGGAIGPTESMPHLANALASIVGLKGMSSRSFCSLAVIAYFHVLFCIHE